MKRSAPSHTGDAKTPGAPAPEVKRIQSRFTATDASRTDADARFKSRTVGMVTLDEYRSAKQGETTVREAEALAARELQRAAKKMKKRKKRKKRRLNTLSFGAEIADGMGSAAPVTASSPAARRVGKDPGADTAFLPDRDRDAKVAARRAALAAEWRAKEEKMRKEKLKVTFSYWNGTGHRRTLVVDKGWTIGAFLEAARKKMSKETWAAWELGRVSSDVLMYIKEDLIIPHGFTFHDLIATRARGKSGPLFRFDVRDDVRLSSDATVESDDSHPGKIVRRSWFEKNKHIFPASRWEVYDPKNDRSGERYTVRGGEVRGKNADEGPPTGL
jgi:protein FAM50